MFCKNCGSEIKEGKFCVNCGSKVDEEVQVEPAIVEESNSTNPIEVVAVNESNTSNNNETKTETNNFNNGGFSSKSKIAAGLFGIFFGAFGVHNFYLGYNGRAVAQLLITLLSCGFLAPVSSIWGMVEGIMILASKDYKDAEGKILKD